MLESIKPAYVCDCGESYLFLMPANCRKCGRPIVRQDDWVAFDSGEYQRFARRVREVGFEKATEELRDGALKESP